MYDRKQTGENENTFNIQAVLDENDSNELVDFMDCISDSLFLDTESQ